MFPRQTALVVGGSRGIGWSIVRCLKERGFAVQWTDSKTLDLRDPYAINKWIEGHDAQFDLVVFSAGMLKPKDWDRKTVQEYVDAAMVHAIGPLALLARMKQGNMVAWWTTAVFISSIGAINAGAVDLGYGMAKAAMEKAVKALQATEAWNVVMVRLDLVDTDMMRQLPTETLHGRPVMSPGEAAEFILKEAGL